jgi:nitroimidazol reductase NimA-like FMN-containing flavoprotein (pyridoxamine 5'-phosphate oxidase superfamily)
MLGEMNKGQITDLLTSQVVGRLGCHADEETYIVPINYIYVDGSIYAHSGNGKKIEMMRKNPKVCFQVDKITDTFRWESVIVWGVFEELHNEERQQAMQAITRKVMVLRDNPSIPSSHGIDPTLHQDLIVYRIKVTTGSGRFESHDDI